MKSEHGSVGLDDFDPKRSGVQEFSLFWRKGGVREEKGFTFAFTFQLYAKRPEEEDDWGTQRYLQ